MWGRQGVQGEDITQEVMVFEVNGSLSNAMVHTNGKLDASRRKPPLKMICVCESRTRRQLNSWKGAFESQGECLRLFKTLLVWLLRVVPFLLKETFFSCHLFLPSLLTVSSCRCLYPPTTEVHYTFKCTTHSGRFREITSKMMLFIKKMCCTSSSSSVPSLTSQCQDEDDDRQLRSWRSSHKNLLETLQS